MLMGNSQRIALYWQDIEKRVVIWFLPGAFIGAGLGAWAVSRIQVEWVGLLLGVVLVLSAFGMFEGDEPSPSRIRQWHFLPAGMAYSCLSGLVGSAGPLLNAMYLGYGLSKERMIATKAVNQVCMHAVKIVFYCIFGVMTQHYFLYGLVIGIAAFPGNWIGRWVLTKMNDQSFRRLAFGFIAIAGMTLIWEQRELVWEGQRVLALMLQQDSVT